jgi:hypothetical protein
MARLSVAGRLLPALLLPGLILLRRLLLLSLLLLLPFLLLPRPTGRRAFAHLLEAYLRLALLLELHLRLAHLLEMHLRLGFLNVDLRFLLRAHDLDLRAGLLLLLPLLLGPLLARLLLLAWTLHLHTRLRHIDLHLRLGHLHVHLRVGHAHDDLRLGLLHGDRRGLLAHDDLWLIGWRHGHLGPLLLDAHTRLARLDLDLRLHENARRLRLVLPRALLLAALRRLPVIPGDSHLVAALELLEILGVLLEPRELQLLRLKERVAAVAEDQMVERSKRALSLVA